MIRKERWIVGKILLSKEYILKLSEDEGTRHSPILIVEIHR